MANRKIFNTLTILCVSAIIFVILLVLLAIGIIDEYTGQLLCFAGINVIIALSLNLITGFTGQLALGQAGFMAVGAYTTAIFASRCHFPLLASLLLGGIVSAIFGIIIGFPTLRLRGDYLAIATLGFGEIIKDILVYFENLTGGAAGMKDIRPFTSNYSLNPITAFSWIYILTVLTIVVVSNLIKSSHGRAIVSIREDEIASNSMGINVPYYKMFAFTMSAFLAGVGGGLYGILMEYLNPSMFGFLNSVNFVVIVVLGGMGSITGTVISGVAFTYIQEWLRVFKDFRLVIFGLALIVIMLFWPQGLMGSKEFSIVEFVKNLFSGKYTFRTIAQSITSFFKKFNKSAVSRAIIEKIKSRGVK